jgi:hypothetical protein
MFSLLLERKCILTVSTDAGMVSTDAGTISTHFGPLNHTETDTGSTFRRAGSTVGTQKSSFLVPGHKGEETMRMELTSWLPLVTVLLPCSQVIREFMSSLSDGLLSLAI